MWEHQEEVHAAVLVIPNTHLFSWPIAWHLGFWAKLGHASVGTTWSQGWTLEFPSYLNVTLDMEFVGIWERNW